MMQGAPLLFCLFSSLGVFSTLARAGEIAPLALRTDDSVHHLAKARTPGSHIKIFLPSLPYLAITHSIYGTLIKPSDSKKGWEFELATGMRKISDTIYEFDLRHGVRFQDGSPFDADSVLLNLKYFKEKPFTYSKIYKVFSYVEKIDPYTER